jgi:NRAMP (natural resistance-associated macrophage protein)-like metal ion transporter
LWIAAEVSIIACDIQGILATAIAVNILFGLPLWLGTLFTCLDLLTFMLIDFAEVDSHQIEWLFVSLVTMMAVCFFWNFSVNPPSPSRQSSPLHLRLVSLYGSDPLWNLRPLHRLRTEYPDRRGAHRLRGLAAELFHA